MKEIVAILMIVSIVLSMYTVFTPEVIAGENVIFQDDFESYAVGTFPYAGGWSIVWNGAGDQYQVINDSYYSSPTKSLQLKGRNSWSVVVKKDFSSSSNLIGYECWIMSTTDASGISNGGSLGFFNRPIEVWGRYYAGAGFKDGYIISANNGVSVQLQPFTPFTWYKIRCVLDKTSRIFNIWIDDVLKGVNLVEVNDPNEILSLQLSMGWQSQLSYFDDVKVFDVSGTPPPQGDIWIENIEPVQTVYGVPLIEGKLTKFRVKITSTMTTCEWIHFTLKWGKKGEAQNSLPWEMPIWPGSSVHYLPNGETIRPQKGIFTASATIEETHSSASTPDIEIIDTDGFRVLYVPVHFSDERDRALSYECLQWEQQSADKFILATFPISDEEYSSELYQKSIEIEVPWECGEDLRWGLFSDTSHKIGYARGQGYDCVVGVVPSYHDPKDRSSNWFKKWFPRLCNAFGQPSGYLGMYYPEKLGRNVVWVEEGYWYGVAHELAHRFGLNDHCTTSSPVYGYWVADERPIGVESVPEYYCLFGNAQDWPNIWRHLPPDAKEWICPSTYNDLLNKLPSKKDPETLLISGLAFENGTMLLDPMYHFYQDSFAPDIQLGEDGNYTLKFLDRSGELLSQTGFNMSFEVYNVTGFCFTVPYVNNTGQIQILQNETLLADRAVSLNAPRVSISEPKEGEVFNSGENVTIFWSSYDPDEDSLTYMVVFTPDNGSTWVPIEIETIQTSLNWIVPNDHPTNQCRIKVVATDGVNTGEDLSSGMFTIFRHDVATTHILTSKTVVGEGYALPINIIVQNNGNYTEPLHLKVYGNTTLIHAKNLTLTSGTSSTVTFAWNTTGWDIGNYTLRVFIEPLAGEINTIDNQRYDMIQILSPNDIHDITIIKLTLSKTIAGQGCNLNISTQILNYGANAEDFNLTICVNRTIIQYIQTTVAGRNSTTITFIWNTTGVAKGNYTISAYAGPVTNETYTTDNELEYGLTLTILGDVNGDFKVNLDDITSLLDGFGSTIGSDGLYWHKSFCIYCPHSPNCDIDLDGKIALSDITTCLDNFGKTYP